MKKSVFLVFLFLSTLSFSQLSVSKVNGGSVITKLSMGISVNGGSTLSREWIVLNDEKCPIQLKDVGINSSFVSSQYRFTTLGTLILSEPIAAFEIHHVLYDVFGAHIESLSDFNVADLNGTVDLKKIAGSWYASENDISKYLSCVTYVAAVRTSSGVIWRYKPEIIKQELSKIQISYEEGFSPSSDPEGK